MKEEQAEFQAFAKEVFNLSPEISLAPELRTFADSYFKAKLERVAKQYPQKFR